MDVKQIKFNAKLSFYEFKENSPTTLFRVPTGPFKGKQWVRPPVQLIKSAMKPNRQAPTAETHKECVRRHAMRIAFLDSITMTDHQQKLKRRSQRLLRRFLGGKNLGLCPIEKIMPLA